MARKHRNEPTFSLIEVAFRAADLDSEDRVSRDVVDIPESLYFSILAPGRVPTLHMWGCFLPILRSPHSIFTRFFVTHDV